MGLAAWHNYCHNTVPLTRPAAIELGYHAYSRAKQQATAAILPWVLLQDGVAKATAKTMPLIGAAAWHNLRPKQQCQITGPIRGGEWDMVASAKWRGHSNGSGHLACNVV